MKYLRYYSEFRSRDNVSYRMEIYQESAEAYTPEEVVLSAEAVELDWGEVDKLEPVHASAATVNLISMSDRKFADMYTVEVGVIRLDILRNGNLYWSGTLDPELFEEPYSYRDRYVTTLTFSDFATLDRVTWQDRGIKSLAEIIDICLTSMNIRYSTIEKHISTTITANPNGDLLADCRLLCDNFFDEDDEPWAMREVLDEVLRPFALRMKQKNGRIWLGDINGMFPESPEAVQWRAADAQLGVEPTYNKVTLTFSPYSDTTLIDGSLDYDKTLTGNISNTTQVAVPIPESPEYNGFTIMYGREYDNMSEVQRLFLSNKARLFRIIPDEDGAKTAGVMWGIRPYGDTWLGQAPFNVFRDQFTPDYPPSLSPIITTRQSFVIPSGDDFRLRASIEVLVDVRRNPYEEASGNNEEGNYDRQMNWVNYAVQLESYEPRWQSNILLRQ